jgi:hypothetical protein
MKRATTLLILAAAAACCVLLVLRPRGADDPDGSSQPRAGRALDDDNHAGTPPPPRGDGARDRPEGPTPPPVGDHTRAGARDDPEADANGQPTPPGADAQDEQDAPEHQADPDPTVWPTSPEGIKGAIAEALPRIRRCYEQALAVDPQMAGTITVAFTIGTTDTAAGLGQVMSAGIADASIEQTTMDTCLLDAMESLQFDPPADGDIEIAYPFTFSVD